MEFAIPLNIAAVMGFVLVLTQPAKRLLERFVGEIPPLVSAAIAASIGALTTVAAAVMDGKVTLEEIEAGAGGVIAAMLAFRMYFSSKGKAARVAAFLPFIGLILLSSAGCVGPVQCKTVARWVRVAEGAHVAVDVGLPIARQACAIAPNPTCGYLPAAEVVIGAGLGALDRAVARLVAAPCGTAEEAAAVAEIATAKRTVLAELPKVGITPSRENATIPTPGDPVPTEENETTHSKGIPQ